MNAIHTMPVSRDTVTTRRAYVLASENEKPADPLFASASIGFAIGPDDIAYVMECEVDETDGLRFLRVGVKGRPDSYFVLWGEGDDADQEELSAPCETCGESGRTWEWSGASQRSVACDCCAGESMDHSEFDGGWV